MTAPNRHDIPLTADAAAVPLTADAAANRRAIERLLAGAAGGTLHLPAGTFPLDGGLIVGPGWTLAGAPQQNGQVRTWLTSSAGDIPPHRSSLGRTSRRHTVEVSRCSASACSLA
ncbi:hypothetical protein AB0M35_27370 [Micromonospora sp. NPDC051196]|uniref:hypothetical protein n=1 Tax=Micromonospora sp. NPDC051196 TaxID=3155281 RepID=UPI00342E0EDE